MWAKLKKTSLDHVRSQQSQEEEQGQAGEDDSKINEENTAENNGANEDEEARDVPTDITDSEEQRKRYERSTSWAQLQRKITPVARKLSREKSKEEEWIVQERLKVNFYLDDGVSKWHIIHPVATGPRQSPIDVCTGRAVLDETLRPIRVEYGKGCVKSVVNTGNSFKVDVDDSKATMKGGALENEFRLIQFHAHWGTTAGAKGSEHTVNGKLFDAELHLVHWNTKYGLMSKAVEHSDGLAVIGIFLEVCEDSSHEEFDKVIDLFRKIHYRNMKADFKQEIDPTKFLPDDMSYWYYPGSLTTPPLNESVLWHLLRTPIKISKSQLYAMASLRTGTSKEDDQSCIINNFRPPVPLGSRTLRLFTGEGAYEKQQQRRQQQQQLASNTVESLTAQLNEMKSLMLTLAKEVKELKSAVKSAEQDNDCGQGVSHTKI